MFTLILLDVYFNFILNLTSMFRLIYVFIYHQDTNER